MSAETPTRDRVLEAARAEGFALAGIAPAAPPPAKDFDHYRQWIEQGHQGEMAYLARNQELRADPRRLFPPARSILMLGMPYLTPEPPGRDPARQGRISCYAWGRDYHRVLRGAARALLRRLEAEHGLRPRARICVDTAPLLERAHAARAGLGWIGKNTLLIHPRHGSYFFLAAILWDLDLEPDAPMPDHCGRCRACLQACPTGAFAAPHRLDARRCIAYHTVERKGPLEAQWRGRLHGWLYGCDLCQQACPFNRRALVAAREDFDMREELARLRLEDFAVLDEADWDRLTRGSAMRRAGVAVLRDRARALLGREAE